MVIFQFLAIGIYIVFAISVLLFWKKYNICLRNIAAFVFGGFIGLIFMASTGNLYADENGQLTNGLDIQFYLASIALGPIAGSFLSLKFLGKANS